MIKSYAIGQSGGVWFKCVSAENQTAALEKYKKNPIKGYPQTKLKAVCVEGMLLSDWRLP